MAVGEGGRAHIDKCSPAASTHPLPLRVHIPWDSPQAHLRANTADADRVSLLSLPTTKCFLQKLRIITGPCHGSHLQPR